MKNILSLTFNLTRFIYEQDKYCNNVEFIFTTDGLDDDSNKHFGEFQDKCKRLGEIYVKGKEGKVRKYVLKRELFQLIDNEETIKERKGITFETKLHIHEILMKEKN